MNWDKSLIPALERLLARTDTPAPVAARLMVLLRSKGVVLSPTARLAAGKRLLDAVDRGTFQLSSPADLDLYLEFLETEGPTDASLRQLQKLLNGSGETRARAHSLVRRFGSKASSMAEALWPKALDEKSKPEDRAEILATLTQIEGKPSLEKWQKLLNEAKGGVKTEVVRSWRAFKGKPEMVALLTNASEALRKETPTMSEELAVVLAALEADPTKHGLTIPDIGRDALGEETLTLLPKLSQAERAWRTRAGRLVFERNACVKCHTTVSQDTPLAPSLKAVARGQKVEYLVESVLYPSKVIKTGYETEQIVTKDGKMHTGLVKDDGTALRLLTIDGETRIAKTDIESRAVQKVSLMPEGQEKQMSRREFLDLIVYLQSLR
jgi:putative heme-binding domain-containing protein